MGKRQWRVIPYPNERMSYPVLEFIGDLEMRNQIKIKAFIDGYLKELDPARELKRPQIGYLDKGLWELRPGKFRLPFTIFDAWGIILITHCFRKETKETPPEEIKRAHIYKNDFESRYQAKQIGTGVQEL